MRKWLAEVLNIPAEYFYTEEDALAELMLLFFKLSHKKKNELIKIAKGI